jgi:F0F1-type ATP synthase membrane subunit b/b'
MQIGGTVVNGIVRLVIVAATLALVYYFILRPILDTTETVSGGIQNNIEKTLNEVNDAFDQVPGTGNQAQIRRQINQSSGVNQDRLINCIQRAQQDVNRIQRCAERFGP